MTHEVAQTEGPDHAGVAFHPPVLLLFALVLGFGAKWLTPLPLLPDDVAATGGTGGRRGVVWVGHLGRGHDASRRRVHSHE